VPGWSQRISEIGPVPSRVHLFLSCFSPVAALAWRLFMHGHPPRWKGFNHEIRLTGDYFAQADPKAGPICPIAGHSSATWSTL
jgi:hypothetical protein